MKDESTLSKKQLTNRRRYSKHNLSRRCNPIPDKFVTIAGKMLNQEKLNKIAEEVSTI